jgi:uncharacterized membrane protein YfcA
VTTEFIVIFLAFLAAGFVHTVAGFGSALVSMPILTQVLAVQLATPIQGINGLALTAFLLYRHREAWCWREASPMIAASFVGVPVGVYALIHLPAQYVMTALGLILIAYVSFVWIWGRTDHLDRTSPKGRSIGSLIAGFFSGLLGGAYATNGPPLIIYGSIKNWPKDRFRSILQSVFFANGIIVIVWWSVKGLVTMEVGGYSLAGLPGLALGIAFGTAIDRHIDHARFRKLVTGLLMILGMLLIVRAARM